MKLRYLRLYYFALICYALSGVQFYAIQEESKQQSAFALLPEEALDRWRRKNNINVGKIPHQKMVEFMQLALQDIPKSEAFDINIAARLLSDDQFVEVQNILRGAVQLAREENKGIIEVKHIYQAFLDKEIGPRKALSRPYMNTVTDACHEIGHGVGTVYVLKNSERLLNVSVQARRNYKQENVAYNNSNRFPSLYYPGFSQPQYYAFGLACSLRLKECNDIKSWDRIDFKNHLIQLFMGGISEDLSKNITPRTDEKTIEQDLDYFKRMPSVGDDLAKIEALAKAFAALQCKKDGFCFEHGRLIQNKLDLAQKKLEQEAFQDARILVASQARKIKKMALRLHAKKFLDGEEIYKELGVDRPLYDFEQKQDNQHGK